MGKYIVIDKALIKFADNDCKKTIILSSLIEIQRGVLDYKEFIDEEKSNYNDRKNKIFLGRNNYGWFYLNFDMVREISGFDISDNVIREVVNNCFVNSGILDTKKNENKNPFDQRKIYRFDISQMTDITRTNGYGELGFL